MKPFSKVNRRFTLLITDKLKQIEAKMEAKAPKEETGDEDVAPSKELEKEKSSLPTAAAIVLPTRQSSQTSHPRKAIPVATRRELWKKSRGRCEYRTPEGKRCDSAHGLEVDHVTPVALGGSNDFSNLRLLCQTHNGYFAQEAFSPEWMGRFMPRILRT